MDDSFVASKTKAALNSDFSVIVYIRQTSEQQESDQTIDGVTSYS